MLALLIAAQVAAASPHPAAPMPNLFTQPARCGPVHDAIVRQVRTAARSQSRMGLQYAVMREVDGCSVPAPVKVKQDYLAPGKWDAPKR